MRVSWAIGRSATNIASHAVNVWRSPGLTTGDTILDKSESNYLSRDLHTVYATR